MHLGPSLQLTIVLLVMFPSFASFDHLISLDFFISCFYRDEMITKRQKCSQLTFMKCEKMCCELNNS